MGHTKSHDKYSTFVTSNQISMKDKRDKSKKNSPVYGEKHPDNLFSKSELNRSKKFIKGIKDNKKKREH